MNLANCKLQKKLLLFLLVSPVILALLPREIQADAAGNKLVENETDSSESEAMSQGNLQAQQDRFLEILEKLRDYDQFMRKMNGVPEKLNKLYAFLPLLQELNKPRLERLERERLEQERLERERLEQERLEQERLKGEMMKSPHAKLYTGTNLTGNFEIYDFNSASYGNGCHRLQNYSEQIKSIDTDGTCVRLFSVCPCFLWSQAFYPGIDRNAIDEKLNGVGCIGPCSPNELEGAEIKVSGSELSAIKGANGVPDLVGEYWETKNKSGRSIFSNSGYTLGAGNRLEVVTALIISGHLQTPNEAERMRNAGRYFTDGRFQLDEEREEVGFAVPLELGGIFNQLYNIFPQDKAAGVKYRETLVPPIKQYLQNNNNTLVFLGLRFYYETPSATKPRGIWYRYKLGVFRPMSGYLFN